MEAFTDRPLSGNAAGVIFLGSHAFPTAAACIGIAAELKHSETAFIRRLSPTEFEIKYFTPVCEAALCGHATIASFSFLRDSGVCGTGGTGEMLVHTTAGDIRVTVEKDSVWLDMARAETLFEVDNKTCRELYSAFELPYRADVNGLVPKAVSVGLTDIMLPVNDLEELSAAKQNESLVSEISRRLDVTGVHMFCIAHDEYAAHCRNFAPLYGIPEECATGTSNGALFHYLSEYGVTGSSPVRFIQGESMGRPSIIKARLDGSKVRVGGSAYTLLTGRIRI